MDGKIQHGGMNIGGILLLVLRSSINSAIHTAMGVLHGQKVCEV
jgi:hypothetical protein